MEHSLARKFLKVLHVSDCAHAAELFARRLLHGSLSFVVQLSFVVLQLPLAGPSSFVQRKNLAKGHSQMNANASFYCSWWRSTPVEDYFFVNPRQRCRWPRFLKNSWICSFELGKRGSATQCGVPIWCWLVNVLISWPLIFPGAFPVTPHCHSLHRWLEMFSSRYLCLICL